VWVVIISSASKRLPRRLQATCLADLGTVYGTDLTEAELRYLARAEWARGPSDVLWRRSKLGLRLSKAEAVRVDEALQRIRAEQEPVA
jgi:glycerol-3-phosphate dehydrogenase